MGTFVIAKRSQEYQAQKNGGHELKDVLIFGNKPQIYSSIEDAASACEKIVKSNILSTWCVFQMVAETKTEDTPVKTYLVEKEDFAGSAEP